MGFLKINKLLLSAFEI